MEGVSDCGHVIFLPCFDILFNNLPASGDFCCLLIAFVNILDPDLDLQNVGPDLDPKSGSFPERIFEKGQQMPTKA